MDQPNQPNENPLPPVPNLNELLLPDAPIVHLLSLKDNPLLKDATTEQLSALLTHIKNTSQSPVVLTSRIKSESQKIRGTSKAAKAKAILDQIDLL